MSEPIKHYTIKVCATYFSRFLLWSLENCGGEFTGNQLTHHHECLNTLVLQEACAVLAGLWVPEEELVG